MSYAVIKTGGKQYKVKSGEILKIEKLPDSKPETKIEFNEILAYGDDKNIEVGNPNIDGAKVEADLIKNIKYTSNNAVGDIYELIADFGQSNLENPNLMFLTNVKGKVIFKDDNKPKIILTSKFADFNATAI